MAGRQTRFGGGGSGGQWAAPHGAAPGGPRLYRLGSSWWQSRPWGSQHTTAEAAGKAAQARKGGAGAAPVPSGRTASARVTPGSTSTRGRRPRSRQSMRTAKSMAPCSGGGAAGGWVLLCGAQAQAMHGCGEAAVEGRELGATKSGRREAAAAAISVAAAAPERSRGSAWREKAAGAAASP